MLISEYNSNPINTSSENTFNQAKFQTTGVKSPAKKKERAPINPYIKKMNSRVVVYVIAVLAIVQFFAKPGYAVTCVEVDVALLPCIGYLRGSGAGLTPACCNGVKAVKGMAQTVADKRTCCNCVKAAANRYPDLKDAAAQSLPAKCGVQLDIPISRSVNCDRI